MKLTIIVLSLILFSNVVAQKNLTIYYFGATTCPPCNQPEVIESVNKIKKLFKDAHKSYDTKFVMVCADKDIDDGLKFINKYEPWDEISVGSFYKNDIALETLNRTNIPGMPHILIYEVELEKYKMGIDTVKSRVLVKDILGGDDIVKWVKEGVKLK